MKKKIVFVLCFALAWFESLPIASAQDRFVPIAIVVPNQAESLDEAQAARLGNKMLEYVTRSGMSATAGSSPIAMLPSIAIEQEDVVEGGMKNIVVLNADVTFFIQNMETGVIYSSVSKQVRGSGTSRQRALNDCITRIQLSQDEFSKFVNQGREKIFDYYRANCSALIAKAEACGKTQQYEEAFAIISSIPSTASCYKQALASLEKYYPLYQKKNCDILLNQARTLWAGHSYLDALSILSELRVFGTDCNKDVTELITTIESRLTENEMREWRILEEKWKTKAYLEEKRLKVIRDIGVAYYGRTVFHNYTYLVTQPERSVRPRSGTVIYQNQIIE
ncbi:MAG: hypothetical protein LBE56_14625 [Tannerella sp.]|jgi:hypothetical protein|nr:hypothetical protein [Tannerella sp.]